jgi:kynurenine formamidase
MTVQSRWKRRPEGANWGEFGADDQLGRLNLIDQDRILAGAAEIKEGRNFCLSLPLDYPGESVLASYRSPPQLRPTLRNGRACFHYDFSAEEPGFDDIVCDDAVCLCTQYSTHWDGLAHIGEPFDVDGDGNRKIVYYNGFRAGIDVVEPGGVCTMSSTALGIEHMAQHGVQGRGVLVDLAKRFGRVRHLVGYDDLRHCLEQDGIAVAPGDILCLHTGFSRLLLDMGRHPDGAVLANSCAALDGCDRKLLNWITDSGIAAIAADNFAVEAQPPRNEARRGRSYVPLHEHCLFKLGMPLGELWHFEELNGWLNAHSRHCFFLTAPPLRLPGAMGSPITPIATV